MTNSPTIFGPRSFLTLLIGLALVMVPAGIIYSSSFLLLGAVFPAAGLNQASHELGAVAWRIVCCLGCAAVAGYFTQTFSKERASLSLGILSGVSVILGLMRIHTSNLYGGFDITAQVALSGLLGAVIYTSGRMAGNINRATS